MGWIAIADLGRVADGLPDVVRERLLSAGAVLVPTKTGTSAAVLDAAGVTYREYAEVGMAPDAPVAQIVEVLRALEPGGVALAVAGYPFMREGVVTSLLRQIGPVEVLPASSPLEVLLLAFDVDVTADLDLVDAAAVKKALPDRGGHLVITGITNAIVARGVSARLSELYASDHPAVLAERSPEVGYVLRLTTVSAAAAHAVAWPEATLYVPPVRIAAPGGFDELVRIMAILRAPDGCPWDLSQDHMTLRRHLIEEAYEAVAAIEDGDPAHLSDELGDILLQVVFHAQIASEAGDFTIDDVAGGIIAKLRRRHPHIFGTASADTPADVMRNWDAIKREERGGGALDGIAHSLPALSYADKMSRRAVAVGFEWDTVDDVWEKVHEEIAELQATEPGSDEAADEVGDVLFTVVNVSRKMGVDPEQALRMTCEKFRRRFSSMEAAAAAEGRDLESMSIDDMEALWRLAKDEERGGS